jgi:hypothetical protein
LEEEMVKEGHDMKEKNVGTEKWNFYEMAEAVGDTVGDVLQSLLVFSALGVDIFITDFTGTVLSEEDLEKGSLPNLDKEAFIIPTGPRFLVPQPVDKEGKKFSFKGVYIPSLVVVPKFNCGPIVDHPMLDSPYYIWTEVPDWMVKEVARPMVAEVRAAEADLKA